LDDARAESFHLVVDFRGAGLDVNVRRLQIVTP
jgi:hypothetical protein